MVVPVNRNAAGNNEGVTAKGEIQRAAAQRPAERQAQINAQEAAAEQRADRRREQADAARQTGQPPQNAVGNRIDVRG